jgi:hypothetical protein
MKEIELGQRVSAWLAQQDFMIYPEVQVHSYSSIADIVGRRGRLLVEVELKTKLSVRVIEQAERWRQYAHMVYIAVPTTGRTRFIQRMVAMLGIGIIVSNTTDETEELSKPTFNRRVGMELWRALDNANPMYAEAGNSTGRRWTPFQATCAQVRKHALTSPGISLKELVDNVKTHYSSPITARACIAQWVLAGKVEGIRLERRGRAWTVWPVDI